ncbi:MAG: DUF190 domain-containing protein [Novosphingobium meiothermophilum]|uniref:DUF190 domain-containing protein n=1 Tax=Novosphingobium TaxID=165696 RepID=UPI000D6E9DD4|nr:MULTISPECIES: DUF190 domain-containing protein [Novosphingobium]
MKPDHTVVPRETGMVRIYLKPSDQGPKTGSWKRFFSGNPLYRELVVRAKADGIMNAVAHHTHFGFSNNGPVRSDGAEYRDPHLTMCVELIGPRDELAAFCARHGALLSGKVVVYKHLEHWTIDESGVHPEDAPLEELKAQS